MAHRGRLSIIFKYAFMKQNINSLIVPLAVALAAVAPTAAAQTAADNTPAAAPAAVAAGDTVAAGAEAALTVSVSGGTAPYTVTWTNGLHNVVAEARLDAPGTSASAHTPRECDLYYVTVTDAAGLQAADTCRVIVTGDAVAATMDNLWLAPESAWFGPDTKGEQVTGTYYDQQMAGSFVSGSYSFSNNYSLDWGSWSGFAYSNSTATKYESLDDQYNSATGGGRDGSANFAVAFDSGTVSVLSSAEGDTVSGFYITNNAYALNSIMNGDAYAHKFDEGDYLRVIFTGTRADGTTATTECYLADFTRPAEADRYWLDTWQWVDLRCLGRVTKIDFMLDGSDKSYGYLNTPAYFCLDDFGGTRQTATAAVQTARSVDLAPLFQFSSNEGTIDYALPDTLYDGTAGLATISADGRLLLADSAEGRLSITVSATQRGQTQFVTVPFDIATAISAPGAAEATEAGRYDLGGRRLTGTPKGLNIIRMTDGSVRKVVVK